MKVRSEGVVITGWISLGWFMFFLFFPFAMVLLTSFAARGPYGGVDWSLNFENYIRALDPLYFGVFLRSFALALTTALACLVIGFPMALAMASASASRRPAIAMALAVPFLTNLVIRVCALKAVTSYGGALDVVLKFLSIPHDVFALSQNRTLVQYGMISSYLPFMVFPLYSALESFDFGLIEAAEDLGATYTQALWRIVIPSMRKAFASGLTLVAIPAFGEYVIPDLLGGAKVMLVGNLVSEQFLKTRDWPFGSALSILVLATLGLALVFISLVGRGPRRV